jgi:hypothetical protein
MIVGPGTQNGKPFVVREPVDRYGSPLDDSYIVHNQTVASDTWIIEHNFGRLPLVTVLDDDNNVIQASVKIELNTATVTFDAPTTGQAIVASVGGAYSDDETILVNPESTEGYPDGTIILRTH